MTDSSDYSKSALIQRLALAYKEDQDAQRQAKDASVKLEVAQAEARRNEALEPDEARTCTINNSPELITVHRLRGGSFTFTVSVPNGAA